jgi:ADP-ribosylglycohydrolase
MIGAIAGDIIGSVFEWKNVKTTDFQLFSKGSKFTDDTVLTVAIADCILYKGDYAKTLRTYGRRYPHAGYGDRFRKWLFSESPLPYNSLGNGSAMRVSPVGFAFPTMEEVLEHARRSAEVTHNHPDGINGAKAVAAAVFLARNDEGKKEIRKYIEEHFMYDLHMTLDEIRPDYRFDPTCRGSVPQAIIAFLESEDYEDAVRKAISIGGDSDTIACITGGIAQAFYRKIPRNIFLRVRDLLPADLLRIVAEFDIRYAIPF